MAEDVIYLTEDFIPVEKDDPRMVMVKVRMSDGRIVFGFPEEVQQNKLFHSGGSGSGDFGHSGRPGEVGGSQMGSKHGRPKPKPSGLYEGKYIPVIDDLSYNSTREGLALRAMQGIKKISNYPKLKGKVVGATLQGSYLSNKEFPKDIDIILEFSDEESMTFFGKQVLPDIVRKYGRVEFGFWSKEVPVSVEVKDMYNEETKKRYGVNPIDLSEWLK